MVKKLVNIRTVLAAMLFFQLAWLAGIWITRASNNWQKLLIVGGLSVLAYLAVVLLRDSFFQKIGDGIDWLATHQRVFLISLAVVLLVFGIFYASQQRIWKFDEESSFYMGKLIAEKGLNEFFSQYALINYAANRHPPLIFMINGMVMSLFGEGLIILRMVTLVFGFAMLVTSYFLASSLYGKKTAILTVIFLLSYPLILRESTAGLLDVQATFFFVLSLLLALKLAQNPSWKLGILLGLSLGLGLVAKYMFMFILPVIFLFFLIRRNYRATALPVILSFCIAGMVFLVWTWYGSQIGIRVPTVAGFSPSDLFVVKQVAKPAAAQAGKIIEDIAISPGFFLTTAWGRGFLLNSLVTRLTSALGPYNLPLILLGLLFLIRQRTASDLFVLMWVGVVSILLILTLPDHRYFMVIFPALAMASARWTEPHPPIEIGRVSFLLLAYQISALYLLVDWNRVNELFMGN